MPDPVVRHQAMASDTVVVGLTVITGLVMMSRTFVPSEDRPSVLSG